MRRRIWGWRLALGAAVVAGLSGIFFNHWAAGKKREIVASSERLSRKAERLERQIELLKRTHQVLSEKSQTLNRAVLIPLRAEKERLQKDAWAAERVMNLLIGQREILDISLRLNATSNNLEVLKGGEEKKGKTIFSQALSREQVQEILVSEISRKKIRVLGKYRRPVPPAPGWLLLEVNRELPPPGSPERYLRQALGNAAIYLEDFFIIHDEAKDRTAHDAVNHVCLEIPQMAMKKLYDLVYVGNWMRLR